MQRLKRLITPTKLAVVAAVLILAGLVTWNVSIFNQRKAADRTVQTTQQKIDKISKEFVPKYKQTEKKAKQEFQSTHQDPLNPKD
ncbi:hypothetical protein M3M35_02730 [Fructilactobacillus myrtifloralis]|uniref:Uncharacterized protein n=1 Tax=Fructilactobacillus myrtifloralis TaxID=2940301 RepID=A0ABY5BPE7_9LACO|nr:hypothetical protein [Fructilactobacillus myrtifloralis]USS85575.1 hypothetical protein M3M35_02730 [Fructilactobacillus myrtifloralis]